MNKTRNPCRCAIYWKVEGTDSYPQVTVYGLTGLIRLNRTASRIWLLSDGRHSVEEILRALKGRFPGVADSRLREELGQFLSRAEARGLLLRRWDPLQPYRIIKERAVE